MRIGILTFHWAVNYGAILQAYCLQEYLKELGHNVEIINYKPREYDISLYNYFLRPSLWKQINKYPIVRQKERKLSVFRDSFLNLSERIYDSKGLYTIKDKYDVIISGSDQILNPSYTLFGERHRPCSAYYLSFAGLHTMRIGYAVSFGCEEYPKEAAKFAREWIQCFDVIGTREKSGQAILHYLNYKNEMRIVPDPTVLYGRGLFNNIGINIPDKHKDYICVYMLRKEVKLDGNVKYIDEAHCPLSMEEWLETISNAKALVTNSYHGSIMAILSHVPFAVILEKGSTAGMNDRFYTLLDRVHLTDRIVNSIGDAISILDKEIDFTSIDNELKNLKTEGSAFLKVFITRR